MMNDRADEHSDDLARIAAALAGPAGAPDLAGAAPRRESRALLLRIARDVAHAGERQNAPLATYLAGRYVELRAGQGVGEWDALAEVEAVIAALGLGGGSP